MILISMRSAVCECSDHQNEKHEIVRISSFEHGNRIMQILSRQSREWKDRFSVALDSI